MRLNEHIQILTPPVDSFPSVSVITLNWNGWKDTIECLESLISMDYPNFNIVVIENGSTDDSKKHISYWMKCHGRLIPPSKKANFESYYLGHECVAADINCYQIKTNSMILNIYLVLIDRNLGFAKGNNFGILFTMKEINPDFILLLNNDTIVEKSLLKNLVETAKKFPKAGIVGPKSYHYYNPNLLGCSGGKVGKWQLKIIHSYAGQPDKNQFSNVEERDFVSGTCMLISTNALRKCGLLNPLFFFGGNEDVDISLRFSSCGYKIYSTPHALLWHKGEVKKGVDLNDKRLKLYSYYALRNSILLIILNYKGLKLLTALIILQKSFIFPLLRFLKRRRSPIFLIETIKGLLSLKK